ncbi:MAG TPA: gephyrin-like molybdotransferase Glp [Frankiaceae bacterium]|nr:gephyrin-like molybdotransferase Glp [Frankiaceae bacterium]
MRTVEEHLAGILRAVGPLPARPFPLDEAHGCVLAEDVYATAPLPGFDNSAMDGYAVRRVDVATASPERPVTLPVAADLGAGPGEPPPLAPGTAARIMTGAPVPPGADAVVPVEWTDGGAQMPAGAPAGGTVRIGQAPRPGHHVRRAGEDLARGALVLPAGALLSAAQVGLLAAAGRDTVAVHPRPRVAVLSTGSELVAAGRPLLPGRVADSNGHALAAAARQAGALAHRVGPVPDDAPLLLRLVEEQLDRVDALVTSGGVSVGAYDVVKQVLAGLGTVAFGRVAMQPGMPQGFGVLRGVPVFTLPGNPVSALVSFEVFVRPALRRMRGLPAAPPGEGQVEVGAALRSPAGKRSFLRVVVERHDDGGLLARPAGGQGSHQLAALAAADALLVVPEDVTDVVAGMRLAALPIGRS